MDPKLFEELLSDPSQDKEPVSLVRISVMNTYLKLLELKESLHSVFLLTDWAENAWGFVIYFWDLFKTCFLEQKS